jgi:signal transduction histidine kinase/CheY-like chemotaxis protein/ligand-binding sensor domain-containing protein
LCCITAPGAAQNAEYVSVNPWQFAHLAKSDGLASDFVADMAQDSAGFWWLATANGLQRFDGKHFTTFTHNPDDPGSLPSDFVAALWIDEKQRLWVATSLGVCRYNPASGKFSPVPGEAGRIKAGYPTMFFRDSLGGFWLATTTPGGLYRYAPEKDCWIGVPGLENTKVVANILAEPETGNLWFLYKTGLGLLERATGKVWLSGKHPEKHPLLRQIQYPSSFYLDSKNKLWIAHLPSGSSKQRDLLTFDLKRGATERVQNALKAHVLFKEDTRGRLWFFLDNSSEFGYFDLQTGNKHRFKYLSDKKNTPVFQGISKIYQDREGNLWLLTNAGLYVFNPDRQHIRSCEGLADAQGRATPIPGGIGFHETARGEIWISTYFGGMTVFDQNFRPLRRYLVPISPPNTSDLDKEDNYNAVWGIEEDARGRIWCVGQHGTLQLFEPDGKLLRRWKLERPLRNTLRTLARDADNNLWVGTQRGWLGKINPEDGRIAFFERAPNSAPAHYVLPDHNRKIWLSQNEAIFRFDSRTNQFDPALGTAPGLRADVYGFIPWNDSTLLAYGNLLYFFDKKRPAYRQSGVLKNLPLRNLLAAIRDHTGAVWFATREGFTSWNIADNRIGRYCPQDGLPETQFDVGQIPYRLEDGRILFSTGKNGFFYFHPDSLSRQSPPPDVTITRVAASGRLLSPDAGRYVCAHHENFLTVAYACLTWHQQAGLRFRYRLLGQSDNWIDHNGERRITLYGMSPGTYTLQIQAVNRFGLSSRGVTSVQIRIRSPWWATAWAFAVYALLIAIAGRLLYRYLLRRKLEQAEIRRIRELEAFKSKFFENITHEFRTPLTILNGAADQIAENPEAELSKGLDTIRANSGRLLALVNQLLDLSKLDSGFLRLDVQRADLVAFLHYLCDSYQSLAKTRNIQLEFQCALPVLHADFDAERLRQIVDNLLSNALKFTPAGGSVALSLEQIADPPRARIRVADTGVGLEKEALPRLFERFYQGDYPPARQSAGTGIGLSLARELARLMHGDLYAAGEPGQGAVFTLELPLQPARAPEAPTSVPAPAPPLQPAPESDGSRPTLLIVEDTPEVSKYLVAILSGAYDTRVAADGLLGLQEAFARVPDLIISDVMMPGMDGFALTDALKTDQRTSHIPIILLTAKAGLENKLQGIGRGADAYLEKPFAKDELLAVARQLVQSRILLRRHYLAAVGLAEAPAAPPPPLAEQENAFLRTVVAALERRLSDPAYSVEQLCAELLMSHSNLHRKIKAVSGLSPALFIRRIRLERAKAMLLEQPELPVYAVAAACGFDDPAYFGRVFRQEFKMSPAAWRAARF